ncbi:Ig-like domain-containing protein [Shewanella algae]|uniref:phage tail tube protein n=1 Tax=Shewanella algae TaxID=38313 RepID=UPI001AB01382|nr:phage tail tube protein [Shewanella algae]MBO2578131.1 Ig-like domain-containing protein [Shewanella algae]
MSSGAKVISHIVRETTPGVVPDPAVWQVMRLTSNAMTPTVNTEESEEITDTRIGQGSIATSVDIGGDLAGELSYQTFDSLLAAAFYNDWAADQLTIGETRITHSIAKGFKDIGVYALFKGAHVSTWALDIPEEGKVTTTFTMSCLDYEDASAPIVVGADQATDTPFMSSLSVGNVKVDGQSLEGVACISAMSLSLDNSLQTQRCLGTSKLGPGALIETAANFTGTMTLAFSAKAWEIWKNQFTRETVSVEFPILDSLGNQYMIQLPKVEVDGDLPSGGRTDILQMELNMMIAKQSPVIIRTPAPTALAVSGGSAVGAGATLQLSVAATPANGNTSVTWTSSDEAVATVDSAGLVTGVSAGTATITATSSVTKTVSDSVEVTVS